MPETAVGAEGDRGAQVTFLRQLLQDCNNFAVSTAERKQVPRRHEGLRCAAVCEEPVPYDLGLLLDPVAIERFARLQTIAVPAERMPHQRQIETSALLRLPDVRHFV